MKNIFKNRRFKYGSLATVITVGFIVALILINVVATLILERYPLSIDLTSDSRFKLTTESVNFVKNVKEDVTITILADESAFESAHCESDIMVSDLYKQAYEIIKDYARNNSKIKVEFVNLLMNPGFEKNYPNEKLNDDDIIVSTSKRYRKFGISDLFTFASSQFGGTTYSSQAEQVMTSALMYVTDDKPATVTLLTGVDNIDTSDLESLLESNNFQITVKNLLTEDIDQDSAMVLFPQPKADLTADQVKKLENYLDNDSQFGKSLIFIASATDEIGPVLKNFLADWGMEVGDGLVTETDTNNIYMEYGLVNPTMMNVAIADNETASAMRNPNLALVSANARPVNALFESKDNRTVKVLAQSAATTVLNPLNSEGFDPTTAEQQAYSVAAVGSKTRLIDNASHVSNVVVFGSARMASSTLLQQGSFSNSDFIVSIVNSITEKKDNVKIIPIDMSMKSINITENQVKIYFAIFVCVIPALMIIAGIVVWLRRRHL